ncbi:MAG: CsgG/HfaB family protein, partial [Kiritimatiellia bacterium]
MAGATATGTAIALDDVSGAARTLQSTGEQAIKQLLPAMLNGWRAVAERPGGALSLSAVLRADDAEDTIILPQPPPEHHPEVAALWRLTPQTGVQEEWMDPLTETLHTVILRSGWFRLVTRDDMAKIMAEHNIQLSDICDTTERAVEFGRIMSARKMLIGTVAKLGNTYQIVLRLVDVETGEIEKAGRAEARGTMDVLFRLTQLAAADMLQGYDHNAR